MLTESFVVSTRTPEKLTNSSVIGIHHHEFQPISTLKHTFKKSSTNANCLAIHPTHIFAAQADKAVIHVYNRDRNNQEAIVPFPEKIHSVAIAGESDGAGSLILGTEGGRLILWELATGRQVSTPQHHLQQTTCLAVDPTSNFLLSGSPDSTIHVWSIPGLLSFTASGAGNGSQDLPFSPLRSLSNHRAAITAIETGHTFGRNNIAVSASQDNTCIVWDYETGDLLHTFLLPKSPLCMTLDPADRAVYAGYEDGSIQFVDFYGQRQLTHQLHNPDVDSNATQPPPDARWPALAQPGSAILCVEVSYDGTNVISGHDDGKVHVWDVATGRHNKQLSDFGAPVTNLCMLKPTGFSKAEKPVNKLHNVIKPRYESFANGHLGNSGLVPSNYTFTAQFLTRLSPNGTTSMNSFQETLSNPSFPPSILDEALADFTSWHGQAKTALDSSQVADLEARNTALEAQLKESDSRQESALAEIERLKKEDWRRQKDEEVKAAKKKKRRLQQMEGAERARKSEMGEEVGGMDEQMDEDVEDVNDLSSSTDELTDDA